MRQRLAVAAVVLGVLVASATCFSQEIAEQREMQTGLKTSDAGYATVIEIAIKMDQMEQAFQRMQEGAEDLLSQTDEAGFGLVGAMHVVLTGPLPPPPGADLQMQIQLPVVEKPTEADLNGDTGLTFVPLEPTQVAYTYHRGPMEAVQGTFMRLFQWLMAEGHNPNGAPRMIITGPPNSDPMKQTAELQVPVQ